MTTNTIQWTPYVEKLMEPLGKLALNELSVWRETDITPALKIDEEGIAGSCQAYSAANIEKIGIGSFIMKNSSRFGMCTIFPAAGYRLPIFFSRWEEYAEEVVFLVDFIPTVDFLVDEDYRKTFLESMGEHWERYGKLPGTCPEENDAVRSVCSIIYNAARVPIKVEDMRLSALAPHTKYLECFIEFLKSATPAETDTKQREINRKVASVKNILADAFREYAGDIAGDNTWRLLETVFF